MQDCHPLWLEKDNETGTREDGGSLLSPRPEVLRTGFLE